MANRSQIRTIPRRAINEGFAAARWKSLLKALVIAALVLWIYGPALHGGWIWDDELYITKNPLMHDPARLWKAWFVPGSFIDYYPIQQTVQWVQWRFWGNNTFGYHVTNVLLHIVNALLVWRLLGKMGVRLAWLGGLLFAVHPLQVESVAWIAELKNTLSLLPILLAMCAWVDYEDRKRPGDYFLALAYFIIALLCKLSVVFFPFVIVLYGWWKRDWIASLKASAPFFAVALVFGLIPIVAGIWDRQYGHLQADYAPAGGFLGRLVLAGQSLAFYFAKVFLPIHLISVYPRWTVDIADPANYLPLLVLVGVIGVLWMKRDSWGRHALLGLGFFVINLAPCPGFIPAPNMGYAWVMDHFVYLPSIGLIGLAVAGLGRWDELVSTPLRPVGVGIAAIMMAVLAWDSRQYAENYVNAETFWKHTLELNPQAWIGRCDLGVVLKQAGRLKEAAEQDEICLQIRPTYAAAHLNLGNIYDQMGRQSEANAQFQQVLQLDPNSAEAHNNLGHSLMLTGRTSEALAQFDQALKINPDYAEAHTNEGFILVKTGHVPEAVEHFERALKINPEYAEAHYDLGVIDMQSDRLPEAIAHFEQALKSRPEFAAAKRNLEKAQALLQAGPVKDMQQPQ